MYNCSLIITYNYYDNKFKKYNEKQNVDLSIIDPDDMINDISETLYRVELLGVFGLEDINEEIINKKVGELCIKLSTHPEFSKIMLIAASKMLSEDLCIGLMVLFSYDSFFLLHKCICEYIKTGIISIELLNDISNTIGLII